MTQSPGLAAQPDRRHRLAGLGAQDTSCFMPLYNGMTEIPRVFRDRRPLGVQPRFGPLGLRLRGFPHPGHLFLGHPGRPPGPGQMGEDGRRQDAEHRQAWALELYKKDPAQAPRVPDRLLPQQRHGRDRRLVEAGRRRCWSSTTSSGSTTSRRESGAVKFPDWFLKLLVEYNKIPAGARRGTALAWTIHKNAFFSFICFKGVFTPASRSRSVCFVLGGSQYKSTASPFGPRIRGLLDS